MVSQDPMDPEPGDVREVEPVDPRRTPCVEPIVKQVQQTGRAERAGGVGAVTLVIGGVLIVGSCMSMGMRRTMGSTRSAHIEWERRQVEIEEVAESEGVDGSVDDVEQAAP